MNRKGAGGFGGMLTGFLVLLVGLFLTPSVATAAAGAAGNLSGPTEKAIVGLVTIFWVIALIAVAAKIAGFNISGGK